MNVRHYLENPALTGENRLPARTLLLPASRRGITWKNYTDSDRILPLDGDWRFSYNETEPGDGFADPAFDDGGWDHLPVPSMWQFRGYGTCFYPNVRYAFPYDPPYIHCENPVGLYRRVFTLSAAPSGRAVLRFLGVDNAYFVWLNGAYVGFSKGSRLAAEFDVTALLRPGENLLAVKVCTWSDASYLENQDMLMASGIFRSVTLVFTGENALWDYTLLPSEKGFAVLTECSVGETPAALRLTLCGAGGETLAETERPLSEKGEAFLPLKDPVFWNAEEPYLYTLYLEILQNGKTVEVHTKRAGIAVSAIRGTRLTLNGAPITLKGVNRHENNAKTGRAIGAAQIERELREIKDCGLNAIRCSHYTNQPLFYELASELGICVMDEADCESHGAEASGDIGALNKDPAWFGAFFDRISRMYLQNKNETCINIWSVGNECGEGENHRRCADWLRAQPVQKPVRTDGEDTPFLQTGYMPMKELLDTPAEDNRPLLLLEYAHAMGNSPGGLEDIWNWIYENDRCCGGYVWEFKSHGFYTPGKNGRPRYLYGGDFPDRYHWSNFSLDGYHRSDGTAKPSWNELREVSAPVHVRWAENGATVKNTYDFKTLSGIAMHWSVNVDGAPVRGGIADLSGIPPRGEAFFPLPLDEAPQSGLVTLDFVFKEGERVLAHKQRILTDAPAPAPAPEAFAHTVEERERGAAVRGADFTAEFREGLPCLLIRDGKTLLDAPMRLNCWRAPTDNDGIVGFEERLAGEWRRALVHTMRFGCHTVRVSDAPEGVTVTAKGRFLPYGHNWGFDAAVVTRVAAGGALDVRISLKPYGNGPAVLPRVGVCFPLPPEFTRCRWLGRGPGENYPDCKAAAPVGLYEAEVTEMNFLYDVPQETGSRQDCRSLTVSGGDKALQIEGSFAFALHDFKPESLTAARHADELEKSEEKYLYIDHRQRGLGSNSCGPQPEAEYELPTGPFDWSFRLSPLR